MAVSAVVAEINSVKTITQKEYALVVHIRNDVLDIFSLIGLFCCQVQHSPWLAWAHYEQGLNDWYVISVNLKTNKRGNCSEIFSDLYDNFVKTCGDIFETSAIFKRLCGVLADFSHTQTLDCPMRFSVVLLRPVCLVRHRKLSCNVQNDG